MFFKKADHTVYFHQIVPIIDLSFTGMIRSFEEVDDMNPLNIVVDEDVTIKKLLFKELEHFFGGIRLREKCLMQRFKKVQIRNQSGEKEWRELTGSGLLTVDFKSKLFKQEGTKFVDVRAQRDGILSHSDYHMRDAYKICSLTEDHLLYTLVTNGIEDRGAIGFELLMYPQISDSYFERLVQVKAHRKLFDEV